VKMSLAAREYQRASIATSTQNVYKTGIKCYLEYCAILGLPVEPIAKPSEDILCCFVSYCASCKCLGYDIINVYLCGVRHHCIMLGYGDILGRTPRLELTMKGIKRAAARRREPRAPITTSVMCRLADVLKRGFHGVYTDIMLQAVTCLAFFGGLRVSELISCKVGDIRITGDVDLNIKFLELFLASSKTDVLCKGVTLKLFATGNKLCPVTAFSKYVSMLFVTEVGSPLFCTSDGCPLTRLSFLRLVRDTLIAAGCDSTAFNTHSFRKGMATSLSAAGVPDHVISTMGRWRSQCYKTYISTPASVISQAQVSISDPSVAKI
jgi:integrase